MSRFEPAVEVVLQHEGGWLPRELDPVGGETMYGISELIIRERGITPAELGVDPETVGVPGWLKLLPKANAVAIYRRYFWLTIYEQIADQTSATKLFDAAVNMPMHRAHVIAQQALEVSPADGLVGPQTVAAINGANVVPSGFVVAFSAHLAAYYNQVADRAPHLYDVPLKPSGKTWRQIWLARAAWGIS